MLGISSILKSVKLIKMDRNTGTMVNMAKIIIYGATIT